MSKHINIQNLVWVSFNEKIPVDFEKDEIATLGLLLQRLDEAKSKVEKQQQIYKLKTRVIDRIPFCPVLRDMVAGMDCRECEIERLVA